jgi:glycosyltransferase involved in cell wall biosynthesis
VLCIRDSAEELLDRGHRVTVLTPVNDDPTYPFGAVVPIAAPRRENLSLPQRALSKLWRRLHECDAAYYEYYLRSFQKALKTLSPAPDAIVLYNDFVSAKFIHATLPQARIFVDLQNEQRSTQRNVRQALSCVHRVLACSRHIREWTVAEHSLPPSQVVVLNSGVDLGTFTPRHNYLDPVGQLKVLFIGRIDPNKGPDIAADAVAQLRKEGHPISLTVAGGLWFHGHGQEMNDPFFRTLNEKMQHAGAKYLGHVTRPHVPDLIRQHDVVCVLSRSREPFGLVVLEAMASGCAVLASNRGGLPDACGDAGVLVDPDDFNAVVAQLRQWATDPISLASEKKRSIQRAARASWSHVATELEPLLTDTSPASDSLPERSPAIHAA